MRTNTTPLSVENGLGASRGKRVARKRKHAPIVQGPPERYVVEGVTEGHVAEFCS